MKRRSFLQRVVLSSGAVLIGTQCKRAGQELTTADDAPENQGSFITEPSRRIPVVDTVDVLVVGGGPSGVAAAVSAARTGAGTLLVERYNHPGGLWTGGLVLPLLATHALNRNNKQVRTMSGLGGEINRRLFEMGMSIDEVNPTVDPEAAKYVLEVMLKEAGVKVYYHSWASQVIKSSGRIDAVILETKSGRVAVRPRVVVDCSGDGDIMHFAGEAYDEMQYEIGLVLRLGNVDRVDTGAPGYTDQLLGLSTPIKSVNWVNMTGREFNDALDFKKLSELQREHRIEIWEKVRKIRSTPGHEEVFLLDTASQQGVRMSRILKGQYELSLEDSMKYRAFGDCIGLGGAWTSLLYNNRRVAFEDRPVWQIPFRSLVPKETANLLVAGRCFSYQRDLFQDARVIGTCLVTGQGAGAGAAEAIRSGAGVQDLDIQRIQKTLKDQNVLLSA